jgi:hypothetical protein
LNISSIDVVLTQATPCSKELQEVHFKLESHLNPLEITGHDGNVAGGELGL